MRPSGSTVEVEAGVTLFREGEPSDRAYYLERGAAEVSVARDGGRVVLCRKGPGELFGEMALVEGGRRSATVTTLEPCQLIVLTREQLLARLEESDPALRLCVSLLMNRLRWTAGGQVQAGYDLPAACALPARGCAADAIRLQQALEVALTSDQLELHFQPIVDLRRRRVAGLEALVRWRHPELGLLPPDTFLPGAEASGLVSRVDGWVIEQACAALRRCRAVAATRERQGLFVAVNVSARTLAEPGFAAGLRRTLARTGVPPAGIKLEITERVLMAAAMRPVLEECREAGVSVALDDFGSGYSNLAYLDTFPIDTLKLDRTFLRQANAATGAPPVLRAVLRLAHDLGLPVVAEGIECREQAELLDALGAAYGQGFHLSRPLPLAAALALLAAAPGSGGGARRRAPRRLVSSDLAPRGGRPERDRPLPDQEDGILAG